MSTIVFHSSSLGVTEYATAFTGLAGNFEALTTGVYLAGGGDDANPVAPATPIVASFGVGPVSTKRGTKQVPRYAYIQADTEGVLRCVVTDSRGTAYAYDAAGVSQRMQRVVLGRGVRDNYLGFTFSNPDALPFRIDRVETVTDQSQQRKV